MLVLLTPRASRFYHGVPWELEIHGKEANISRAHCSRIARGPVYFATRRIGSLSATGRSQEAVIQELSDKAESTVKGMQRMPKASLSGEVHPEKRPKRSHRVVRPLRQ